MTAGLETEKCLFFNLYGSDGLQTLIIQTAVTYSCVHRCCDDKEQSVIKPYLMNTLIICI